MTKYTSTGSIEILVNRIYINGNTCILKIYQDIWLNENCQHNRDLNAWVQEVYWKKPERDTVRLQNMNFKESTGLVSKHTSSIFLRPGTDGHNKTISSAYKKQPREIFLAKQSTHKWRNCIIKMFIASNRVGVSKLPCRTPQTTLNDSHKQPLSFLYQFQIMDDMWAGIPFDSNKLNNYKCLTQSKTATYSKLPFSIS